MESMHTPEISEDEIMEEVPIHRVFIVLFVSVFAAMLG